jgi:hypothetical protein
VGKETADLSLGLTGVANAVRTRKTRAASDLPKVLISAVRLEGAYRQWRKDPPRELSIALVADERFGWATGRIEAS